MGECSDLSHFMQSFFHSSANQAFVPILDSHRFVCWSCCAASICSSSDLSRFHDKDQHFHPHFLGPKWIELYAVSSFVPHSDRHDYRQIPCAQVTTEIQKCCQLAASESGYRFVLVYRDLRRIELYLLELSDRFETDRCVFRAMDVHITHVLHDDLSHTSKATSAGARKQWPLILEQWNVSLAFSNLQEDTIWHRLGAIGLSSLLFPVSNFGVQPNGNKFERRKGQHSVDVSNNFDLLQFFDKPCSLLLENETSKASSEGYGFAGLLLLMKLIYYTDKRLA